MASRSGGDSQVLGLGRTLAQVQQGDVGQRSPPRAAAPASASRSGPDGRSTASPATAWPRPAPPSPLDPRPRHGQVAAMIDQPLLLLERAVVLLVDDEQSQALTNGRNRAERAPTTILQRPATTASQTCRRRGGATPECHSAGAAPKRAVMRVITVLGQGDLGQQDQDLRRRIGPQGLRRRLQIGLGLARAGHPVEQEGGEAALDCGFGRSPRPPPPDPD
jgi:hypothetical protein